MTFVRKRKCEVEFFTLSISKPWRAKKLEFSFDFDLLGLQVNYYITNGKKYKLPIKKRLV